MNDIDTRTDVSPGRGMARTGTWIGAIAAVLALVLIPFYFLPAPVGAPFVLVALVMSVGGVVLCLRSRRRRVAPLLGLVLSAAGLVLALVMLVVLVLGVVASHSRSTQVEIRAKGSGTYVVHYTTASGPRSETASGESTAKFAVTGDSTSFTVTAEQGQPQDVSCEILWDGELVAHQESTSGEVTCTYRKP